MRRIYYTNRTRDKKAYEVFAGLFPDVVKPVYDAACVQQGVTGKKKLPVWHATVKTLWNQATPEQQDAVNAKFEDKVDEPADALHKMLEFDGDDTPETYQQYEYSPFYPLTRSSYFFSFQNVLPNVLQATLDPACRKAGIMAVLTIVGPVPKLGGRINTTSWVVSFHLSYLASPSLSH